ncbi:MAG TPA: ATP phosphoribosyltransferase regulatory subunit [Clostridia bacterium]
MPYKKSILPIGVQDYLPEECFIKSLLEQKIADTLKSGGYKKIEPPTFEYLETFNYSESARLEKVFKFMDFDGKILALRSDPTLQISRIAATKLPKGVHRLFYILNSYEFSNVQTQTSRTREFAQAGVELIGAKGSAADAEVLATAIECLLACGLDNFKIDIGQVDYFLGIMNSWGLNDAVIEKIRERINCKDLVGVKTILQSVNLPEKAMQDILTIPKLFGGIEVLKHAQEISNNPQSDSAIKNIQEIFDSLSAYGYTKYISIDLGMLPHLSYYSGIIFRGMTDSVGAAILEGGRYDNLSVYFGADIPSVGFSIGIKRLMTAIEKTKGFESPKASDYAYMVLDGCETQAFKIVKDLKSKGLWTERAFVTNENELIKYCQDKNIKKYIIISKDGIKEGAI